jgi:hypothetical protein
VSFTAVTLCVAFNECLLLLFLYGLSTEIERIVLLDFIHRLVSQEQTQLIATGV